MKSRSGFTIVELLIVIVVIAILAAISIVAYTGIQNRANDAAVKSDLSALAKKFEIYKIDSAINTYPAAALAGSGSFQVPISKGAYQLEGNQYNLLNCRISGGAGYALIAQSKSGKYFMVSSGGSVQEVTASVTLADASSCPVIAPGSVGYGAGYANGGWRGWTNG